MKIIEKTYSFGAMDIRKTTKRIILHHAAAATCSADDVHRWHKVRGWAGIGYHFFIRKDGSVYRARPEKYVGAHAGGANYDSIGICFEGNYDTERTMPDVQRIAGSELVSFLKEKYGITRVQGHRDVGSTACPGRYFPFEEIAEGVQSEPCIGCVYGAESFIRDLQTLLQQEETGEADDALRNALPQVSDSQNRAHPVVKALQVRLFALGYKFSKYGADGDFGEETGDAVEAFQKARNLSADRIVGKDTWDALMKD